MSTAAAGPWRPAPRSLADVRDPDRDTSYPVALLGECRTALVLFAARWHGRQDAVHLADAGLKGTCVDIDKVRLREMADVYPEGWEFVGDDVYQFAAAASGVERWDVVSLDPFSEQFERCANLLDLWCSIANHLVILGTSSAMEIEPPLRWKIAGRKQRSTWGGGVDWVALTRA